MALHVLENSGACYMPAAFPKRGMVTLGSYSSPYWREQSAAVAAAFLELTLCYWELTSTFRRILLPDTRTFSPFANQMLPL